MEPTDRELLIRIDERQQEMKKEIIDTTQKLDQRTNELYKKLDKMSKNCSHHEVRISLNEDYRKKHDKVHESLDARSGVMGLGGGGIFTLARSILEGVIK